MHKDLDHSHLYWAPVRCCCMGFWHAQSWYCCHGNHICECTSGSVSWAIEHTPCSCALRSWACQQDNSFTEIGHHIMINMRNLSPDTATHLQWSIFSVSWTTTCSAWLLACGVQFHSCSTLVPSRTQMRMVGITCRSPMMKSAFPTICVPFANDLLPWHTHICTLENL